MFNSIRIRLGYLFRKLLTAGLLLSSLPLMVHAAPPGWEPLLEPAELATIMGGSRSVRVIHVTGDFAASHIPGAANAPYPQWRGPQANPGSLPALEKLTALVQSLGIRADTPVAIVHQGTNPADMGSATRVYWTLKSLGITDLAVVNGGFAAWTEAGLPISSVADQIAPSTFVPQWSDKWRVTTAEVETLVSEGSARLIDARPDGFFKGLQSSAGRPGTIHGAGNLNFESWFDGNRMKELPQMSSILSSYPVQEAPLTVSFCNTGHQASVNWFVLSELQGVPNTRLYAESMAEWSLTDRPMDNQPSRVKIYWDMTKGWFSELLGS
ncbi:MAG: rhodanese-like domain-containing protein [Gammaproteobacteria bacterium]|nr:rhodanese-like domain-containing protein [Gammaproteobacteria bacterium]